MKQDNSFSWSPKKLVNLESLNIIIVGGTGGLGRAIAQVFAASGATITVIGRTFKDEATKNIKFVKADLSSIKDSRKVADELDVASTDILLFTTGIFASTTRQETSEGLERDMAVSYLNRLAMIDIIVPKLSPKKNSFGFTPRVFLMAYPGNDQLGSIDDMNIEKNYGAMKAHMNTVAGNEALVYDSVSKFKGHTFYGLNPGLVKTNIRDNFLGDKSWKSTVVETLVGWFTNTPEQYASIISPLLIAPELEHRNGGIFNNKGNALQPSKGLTPEYASKFTSVSRALLESKNLV